MNEMKVFSNEEFGTIRTIIIEDEPYFVGKEVAERLGYSNTRDAINKHVDEEDKTILRSQNTTLEIPNRGMTVINESGLYSLILSSKLPTAKKFKRWIISEVLPAIRKHGGYLTPQKIEEVLLNPDTIIALAQNLKAEQEKNKVLTEKVEQQQEQLQLQQPAVEFTEQIKCAENSTTIGTLAKIMSKKGINIGRNQLFEWLRNSGYLIKQKGRDYNKPKQPMIVYGYMEVKTSTHEDERSGKIYYNNTPLVTGKGIIYLIKKYREYIEKITLPHATI